MTERKRAARPPAASSSDSWIVPAGVLSSSSGRQGGGWAPEEPWAVGGPRKYPTSPLGTFDGQTAALGGEAP